ncbi:MAG: OmpA family protein [Bryobacteraceae bacterium]
MKREAATTASRIRMPLIISAIVLTSLAGMGCATKKYVRTQIDPVTGRVVEVEKSSKDHQARLGQLDTEVSQADEKAQEADKKAVNAGQEASKAQQQVASARTELSGQINGVRDEANGKFADVQKQERMLDPANYKQVLEDSVLFGFGKSVLTKEAQEKLDQLAPNLTKMPYYVVEIEGYTDKTGDAAYNIGLSQKRADAVVRYLSIEHQIPLRRIHVLGAGVMKTDAHDRESRKQARKVNLRVFAPEGTQMSSLSGTGK